MVARQEEIILEKNFVLIVNIQDRWSIGAGVGFRRQRQLDKFSCIGVPRIGVKYSVDNGAKEVIGILSHSHNCAVVIDSLGAAGDFSERITDILEFGGGGESALPA